MQCRRPSGNPANLRKSDPAYQTCMCRKSLANVLPIQILGRMARRVESLEWRQVPSLVAKLQTGEEGVCHRSPKVPIPKPLTPIPQTYTPSPNPPKAKPQTQNPKPPTQPVTTNNQHQVLLGPGREPFSGDPTLGSISGLNFLTHSVILAAYNMDYTCPLGRTSPCPIEALLPVYPKGFGQWGRPGADRTTAYKLEVTPTPDP